MSRSNPNEDVAINPCKHWFQWDGGDGKGFKQYDKEAKKNIIHPLPFKFLLLDKLITITGYNEPRGIGYYSNEVRSLKDKLIVRSKDGVEAEGSWEEVKAKIGTQGANFAQSVYIMFYVDKQPMLGNIKMSGAALETWFDFCKNNKVNEIGIQVKTTNTKKKGKVEYFEPVFEAMKITEASNKFAVEMDKELQTYLTAYLIRNSTSVEAPKIEEKQPEINPQKQETKPEEKGDLPWEKNENNSNTIVTNADDSEEAPF